MVFAGGSPHLSFDLCNPCRKQHKIEVDTSEDIQKNIKHLSVGQETEARYDMKAQPHMGQGRIRKVHPSLRPTMDTQPGAAQGPARTCPKTCLPNGSPCCCPFAGWRASFFAAIHYHEGREHRSPDCHRLCRAHPALEGTADVQWICSCPHREALLAAGWLTGCAVVHTKLCLMDEN